MVFVAAEAAAAAVAAAVDDYRRRLACSSMIVAAAGALCLRSPASLRRTQQKSDCLRLGQARAGTSWFCINHAGPLIERIKQAPRMLVTALYLS